LDDVKAQSLRHAKEEAWFIGATMHYTFQNSKELFVEKVQQGLRVNVLIADPTGEEFESTARSFGQRKKDLDAESRMTLTACVDVLDRLERTPNVKGCLSVKLLDRVFMAGLYIFDPRSETATMLLVPHITGHDAPLVPGFVVKRTNSGVFNDYFDLYSAVWNRAQSFELWRRENSDYLPEHNQDLSLSEEN
jgi:hypothetical protein